MKGESTYALKVSLGLSVLLGSLAAATAADGQTPETAGSSWMIGASTGAYLAPSALIRTAEADDTELLAGPAFSLEAQVPVEGPVAVYGSGLASFSTIGLGSAIQPEVVGPSKQVVLLAGSAGVVLTGIDWFGELVQPTLRLGGGLKWYRFELTGAENQIRPTADVGLGLRGIGLGAIGVTAEVRYLLSSFDQSKMPTRGIAPQDQRQHDLLFSIGVGIRP